MSKPVDNNHRIHLRQKVVRVLPADKHHFKFQTKSTPKGDVLLKIKDYNIKPALVNGKRDYVLETPDKLTVKARLSNKEFKEFTRSTEDGGAWKNFKEKRKSLAINDPDAEEEAKAAEEEQLARRIVPKNRLTPMGKNGKKMKVSKKQMYFKLTTLGPLAAPSTYGKL